MDRNVQGGRLQNKTPALSISDRRAGYTLYINEPLPSLHLSWRVPICVPKVLVVEAVLAALVDTILGVVMTPEWLSGNDHRT